VSAPDDDLVDDAVRWAGGDPEAHADCLPPWFFAWWGVPLLAELLLRTPYPALKVINQGFAVDHRSSLPRGQSLELSARIMGVREEPTKVRLHMQLVTGTADIPEAQVVDLYTVIPQEAPSEAGPRRKRRAPPIVDAGWCEVAEWRNDARAGLDFARLTGDFNPIHWMPLAARASGFQGCILHGFGTAARALEHLARYRWADGMAAFAGLDARFTAPLTLPGHARLYLGPPTSGDETTRGVAVGRSAGGTAFLLGTVRTR
ncbi:MAG: MaoC/PaaZ C-terminal domain-containing protein, partial [Myxococcota bacterium]|nr:MaoC/PaaZ C-terminal domain-containing protein [Myxococcota bacterium]